MSSIGNPPPDIGSTERVKRPLPALPTSKNTSMPPIVQKEAEHVEELVKLEDLILQDQDANKANSHDSTPVSEHKVYNLEELMESGPVLDLDIEVSPDDVDFDALVESESQKEASEPKVLSESTVASTGTKPMETKPRSATIFEPQKEETVIENPRMQDSSRSEASDSSTEEVTKKKGLKRAAAKQFIASIAGKIGTLAKKCFAFVSGKEVNDLAPIDQMTKSEEYGRVEGIGIGEAPLTDNQMDKIFLKLDKANSKNKALKEARNFEQEFRTIEDDLSKVPLDKKPIDAGKEFAANGMGIPPNSYATYLGDRNAISKLLPIDMPETKKLSLILNFIRAASEQPQSGGRSNLSIENVQELAKQHFGGEGFEQENLNSLMKLTNSLLNTRNSMMISVKKGLAKSLVHSERKESEQLSKEARMNVLADLEDFQTIFSNPLPEQTILSSSAHSDRNYGLAHGEEGCVDYSFVDPMTGQAYVADTTGHDKPDAKEKLDPIHSKLQTELQNDPVLAVKALMEFGKAQEEDAAQGGTCLYQRPVMTEAGLQLFSLSVGDGRTYIVDKEGRFEALPYDPLIVANAPPADFSGTTTPDVRLTPLRRTDRSIVSLSDGIVEFMGADALSIVWAECNQDATRFATACIQVMVAARAREVDLGGEKQYDPRSSDYRDDCSVTVTNLRPRGFRSPFTRKQQPPAEKAPGTPPSNSSTPTQSISLEPQQPTTGTRFAELNKKLEKKDYHEGVRTRLTDEINAELEGKHDDVKLGYLNALKALEDLYIGLDKYTPSNQGEVKNANILKRNAALAFAEQLGNWAKNNPNEEINSETEGLKKFPFEKLNLGDEQTLEVLNQAAQATLAMMQEP